MFENKTEQQAKEEILKMVEEYCNTYHNQKKAFQEGDRIPYACLLYTSSYRYCRDPHYRIFTVSYPGMV